MTQTVPVRQHQRGFTLVELLVVILILSILMAVALPLYLSAVTDSRRKTNRANMRSVAIAVQTAYVKGGYITYADFAGPISSAKEPDLTPLPIGPNREVYTVVVPGSKGGPYMVECSDASAGTYEPGFDNN